ADSMRVTTTTLLARLASEPSVVGATVASGNPWEGSTRSMDIDGANGPPERTRVSLVDANYFGLFGVRLLAGRALTVADAALPFSTRPVMVNRSFVAELLGGGDPIGRRVRYRGYNGEVQP